jgi:hypothetical protein
MADFWWADKILAFAMISIYLNLFQLRFQFGVPWSHVGVFAHIFVTTSRLTLKLSQISKILQRKIICILIMCVLNESAGSPGWA